MDIRELVVKKREENLVPEDLKKRSFSLWEAILLFYLLFFIVGFGITIVTSDDFTMATSKSESCFAYITDVEEEAHWRYYKAYFTSEVDTFYTSFEVSDRSPLYKLAVKDSVEVTYSIKSPEVHRISGLEEGGYFMYAIFPVLLIVLIFLIPVVLSILRKRKIVKDRVSLWDKGELLLGTLAMVKSVKKLIPMLSLIEPRFEIVVDFEYESKSIRSKTIVQNAWLLEQLKRGETITLLVNPENPENIVAIEEFVY